MAAYERDAPVSLLNVVFCSSVGFRSAFLYLGPIQFSIFLSFAEYQPSSENMDHLKGPRDGDVMLIPVALVACPRGVQLQRASAACSLITIMPAVEIREHFALSPSDLRRCFFSIYLYRSPSLRSSFNHTHNPPRHSELSLAFNARPLQGAFQGTARTQRAEVAALFLKRHACLLFVRGKRGHGVNPKKRHSAPKPLFCLSRVNSRES